MLHIYNSLTGQKEEFKPIDGNRVRIYVCGMTVYDYCHLGHARVMVGFDAIVRYLRYRGYEVTYVRNITDIDDKIINRANELGVSTESLTDRYIRYMNEDLDALFVVKPDHEPRATEFIPNIVEMISELIERGYAYPAENGDVYYRTRQFKEYGKLSGTRLDDLVVGARIAPDEMKNDPVDFVLWKGSKPGEPSWNSPWGEGRPGWHIECSAMSTSLLGSHFDIHGGGRDLLFPHHENEIAQSEAATDQTFVNVWMHNGYLEVNSEKMSKSLHNFLTIREILAQDTDPVRMGEVLRFTFLMCHYRSPLNYSDSSLENAKVALRRIYLAIRKFEQSGIPPSSQLNDEYLSRFQTVMDDDFNTPDALAVIFDCVRELNRAIDTESGATAGSLYQTLLLLNGALGVGCMNASRFLGVELSVDSAGIRELVLQREEARRNKQWQTADELRRQLTALGVELEDRPDGTSTWRKL